MPVDIWSVAAAIISLVLLIGGALLGMIWADRQFKKRKRAAEESKAREEAEAAAACARMEEAAEAIHELNKAQLRNLAEETPSPQ